MIPGLCPACRAWRVQTARWCTSPPAPAVWLPASVSPIWCCRSIFCLHGGKKYRLYSGTVSRFEQQTLARFITEGYFTRHLARERVAYKARRDALAAALNTAFAPGELNPCGPAHRTEPAGKAQRPAAGCCAALRGGSRRRAAEPAERLRPDRRSTLSGGHAGAGLWLAEGRGLRLGGRNIAKRSAWQRGKHP